MFVFLETFLRKTFRSFLDLSFSLFYGVEVCSHIFLIRKLSLNGVPHTFSVGGTISRLSEYLATTLL